MAMNMPICTHEYAFAMCAVDYPLDSPNRPLAFSRIDHSQEHVACKLEEASGDIRGGVVGRSGARRLHVAPPLATPLAHGA